MIAKSDVIILALSTTFLVAGIIRWQHNTSVVPVVTIPASSQGEAVRLSANGDSDFSPVVTRLPARTEEEIATSRSGESDEPAGNTEVQPSQTRVSPALAVELDTESSAQSDVTSTTESQSPVSDPSPELLGTYTVVSGDYLGWIAEEFGTTVARLKEINGLESNDIRIGQKIKYPLPNK